MPAGTIALTNNSAVVTGTGTSFTSELKANDFVVVVVGGVTYTLGVKSVESATALTLIAAYGGATISGLSWTPVPNATLVGITAQVAADVAKAIRGLNLDKANWQQIFSSTGNVTVSLPDGSQFSGPGWNYMANQYSNKTDKSQNLVDLLDKSAAWLNLLTARTAATARSDLGIKSLALQDLIDRSDLNAELLRYTFSTGGRTANIQGAGVWGWDNTTFGYGETYGTCLQVSNRSDGSGAAGAGIWQHYLGMGTGGNLIYASNINGQYRASKVYTTFNTTTNSTGALVPASPIVRIVNDRDTVIRMDLLGVSNEEYSWVTKRALCNEESKGCTVSRTATGTYLVKGAAGLAKDLWKVMDCGNGQGRIIALAEAEETAEGIVVRCFRQKYSLSDDGDLTVVKGALTDIPDETWIDVRLEMPSDSEYNRRLQDVAIQMQNQEVEGTDA